MEAFKIWNIDIVPAWIASSNANFVMLCNEIKGMMLAPNEKG